MRLALALTLLAALPAAAQAQTTWSGSALSISGNRANGCDLRVVEATHAGNTLNPVRLVVMNRATTPARASAEVTLSGNGQRKVGTVTALVPAGQQATMQGFYPFGGSLAGTTLVIRFLGCTQG